MVIWFTGLPCSGKSTLADALSVKLEELGLKVQQLDGDVVRKFLPALGFTKEDRNHHIKQMALVANMLERNGIAVVGSFVSPYRESRDFVRTNCQQFIEIHVATPLTLCEQRDVKGMYKKARTGEIKSFTGIDDPYEEPINPEITIDTTGKNVNECIEQILNCIDITTAK